MSFSSASMNWLLGLFCLCVGHAQGGVYSGGSGTLEDPYQIATKADLLELGANTDDFGGCFVMTSNIDLSGENFTNSVIGVDTNTFTYGFQGIPFHGVFDGDGHVVRNVFIDTCGVDDDSLGLFGCLYGYGTNARILNLGVENVVIVGGSDSDCLGCLCADNYFGTIKNCYSTGSVSGDDRLGGLCGGNSGWISDCFSTSSVSGGEYSCYLGGLCGSNTETLNNCFSTGMINGTSTSLYLGGLCGRSLSDAISGCFWDTDSSGMFSSGGGIGKTTSEMQTQSTFSSAGWDFNNVWIMNDLPVLRCFRHDSKNAFELWVESQSIPDDALGESDSPVGDGVPNLIKFACGLPALEYCSTSDLMSFGSESDGRFFMAYYKSKSADGVLLEPVCTSSLNGSWGTNGMVNILTDDSGDREQWKAVLPLGSRGFARLRATLTE